MTITENAFETKFLKRKEDIFIMSPVGDEIVLMNIETGKYLGINRVGTEVWNLLEQPKTFNQLLEEILNEFEVTKQQAEDEVKIFLSQLDNYNLIEFQ